MPESPKQELKTDTQIKAFTLKNDKEVYGYIDTRKVDRYNDEVKILQALGFIDEGSLYLGDSFTHLSDTELGRNLTEEEYKKFLEKIEKLEADSNAALVKLANLKTL